MATITGRIYCGNIICGFTGNRLRLLAVYSLLKHGLDGGQGECAGGQGPVEIVPVGPEAVAVNVDEDGVVVGAGFVGGLGAGAEAGLEVMVLPVCDDNDVAVFAEGDAEFLVELDDAITEQLLVSGAREVERGMLAAVDQNLDAVNVDPVRALDADVQFHLAIEPGVGTSSGTILSGDFQVWAGGEDHTAGFGVAADLGPVDLGGIVGTALDVSAPTADSIAIDGVGVTNCDAPVGVAAVEELEPEELPVLAELFAPTAPPDVEGGIVENVAGAVVGNLDAVDHVLESAKAPIGPAVQVAVNKLLDQIWMVDVNPTVSPGAAPVAEQKRVQAWIR